jgi:hypothetical protein
MPAAARCTAYLATIKYGTEGIARRLKSSFFIAQLQSLIWWLHIAGILKYFDVYTPCPSLTSRTCKFRQCANCVCRTAASCECLLQRSRTFTSTSELRPGPGAQPYLCIVVQLLRDMCHRAGAVLLALGTCYATAPKRGAASYD